MKIHVAMRRPPKTQPGSAAPSARELVERVGRQVRRMGAQTVLTSHTVADHFGLHTTDLECLDLIFMHGRTSPGELTKATGLSSGAMTALLDRLENAGYVTRAADPDDRRRVQVRARAEALRPIETLYRPMQRKMFELWSSFTVGELGVIERFLSQSIDLAVASTERLRTEVDAAARRRTASGGHAGPRWRGAGERSGREGRPLARPERKPLHRARRLPARPRRG